MEYTDHTYSILSSTSPMATTSVLYKHNTDEALNIFEKIPLLSESPMEPLNPTDMDIKDNVKLLNNSELISQQGQISSSVNKTPTKIIVLKRVAVETDGEKRIIPFKNTSIAKKLDKDSELSESFITQLKYQYMKLPVECSNDIVRVMSNNTSTKKYFAIQVKKNMVKQLSPTNTSDEETVIYEIDEGGKVLPIRHEKGTVKEMWNKPDCESLTRDDPLNMNEHKADLTGDRKKMNDVDYRERNIMSSEKSFHSKKNSYHDESEDNVSDSCLCEHCGAVFSDKNHLFFHHCLQPTETACPNRCKVCGINFPSAKVLNTHLRTNHIAGFKKKNESSNRKDNLPIQKNRQKLKSKKKRRAFLTDHRKRTAKKNKVPQKKSKVSQQRKSKNSEHASSHKIREQLSNMQQIDVKKNSAFSRKKHQEELLKIHEQNLSLASQIPMGDLYTDLSEDVDRLLGQINESSDELDVVVDSSSDLEIVEDSSSDLEIIEDNSRYLESVDDIPSYTEIRAALNTDLSLSMNSVASNSLEDNLDTDAGFESDPESVESFIIEEVDTDISESLLFESQDPRSITSMSEESRTHELSENIDQMNHCEENFDEPPILEPENILYHDGGEDNVGSQFDMGPHDLSVNFIKSEISTETEKDFVYRLNGDVFDDIGDYIQLCKTNDHFIRHFDIRPAVVLLKKLDSDPRKWPSACC